jgi:hypothetical protein
MKVELEFRGSVAGGEPKVKVYSRHTYSTDYFLVKDGVFSLTVNIDFAPVDCLKIQFFDKIHISNSDKDTFIELKKISIDEINLQHFLFKGKFYPCYNENFYRNFNRHDYYQPGSTMYHNGTFEIDIKTPIWKFLMDSYYNA